MSTAGFSNTVFSQHFEDESWHFDGLLWNAFEALLFLIIVALIYEFLIRSRLNSA